VSAAKVIIAAAAVGIGLVLISRHGAAAPVGTPTPATPPGFVPAVPIQFGPVVPQLGPAYSVLKPIADNVTTPLVHALNGAVGGATPFGGLKSNGDGTYTDGLGATITPNADGTVTRKAAPWRQTNGGRVIVAVGSTVQGGASAVGHFVSGLL
jgi:hypothetical protein